MGISLSTPKDSKMSSYDLLGINEFTLLEETHKAYCKLFYKFKSDEDKMVLINKAHEETRKSLNLDLYLELYSKIYNDNESIKDTACKCKNKCICEQLAKLKLKTNNSNSTLNRKSTKSQITDDNKFKLNNLNIVRDKGSEDIIIKYKQNSILFRYNLMSNDFFERLKICFDIKIAPKFFDSDFVNFYNFWKKFSHVDKEMEAKIRVIIKIIERNDPRIKINSTNRISFEISKNTIKKEKVREKNREKACNLKEKKFYCYLCKKGFNNSNTAKDHLNSKQHLSKVGRSDGDTQMKDALLGDISKITEESIGQDSKIVIEDDKEQSTETPQENESRLDTTKDEKTKSEHILLRTCGICKIVLKTRGELIMHLKACHS